MIVKRLVLPATAAALIAGGALEAPACAPANQAKHNGPPSTTPNNADNPGSSHRSTEGTENTGGKKHNSGSHKCKGPKGGLVGSGVLVSWKLEKNTDGPYSGEVTVAVKHTNRHGRADKGT